jgi:spermidine synthase
MLRLTFGSTTLAVSTVLVAYMLGLGLGGLLGGRLAKRLRDGVRAYGWIEIGIGVFALVAPYLLGVLPGVNFAISGALPFWQAALCRFVLALAVLLLPTILMGATLPVLVEATVRRDAQIARRVGLLYGLNTLGAVAGVMTATFVMLPTLGVWRTNLAAAALDIVVGAVAFTVLSARFGHGRAREETGAAEAMAGEKISPWNPAVLAYGAVGYTALTYEVCWTRALAMILGSSIYAFATMLAAFLTGIALGSLVGRRWLDGVRRPTVAYALGIGAVGVLALGTIAAFRALPAMFVEVVLRFGTSPLGITLTNVSISVLAMLGPTLVLGALFPLLVRSLASRAEQAPEAVGTVYFANTLGSAAGAFATGFVLIPLLGLQRTMGMAVALNLVVAALLLAPQTGWRSPLRPALVVAAVVAALLVVVHPPGWSAEQLAQGVFKDPVSHIDVGIEPESLLGVPEPGMLFYREGINTTVSVHREEGNLFLRVNGKTDASTAVDMETQVLLGQLPWLFGAKSERALVIGLASGITVGSAALHRPALLEVAELEPAMVEVSSYFDDYNHRPLEQPGVRLVVDDGRNVLAYAREPYDVIISEPSNPWITGAASLFTREFFAAARRALRPEGQLVQWVQLYSMPAGGLRSILAAVSAEFPYVYGFVRRAQSADLLLLARNDPLAAPELPRWEELAPAARDDLLRIGIFSTPDLWALLRFPPESIRTIAATATPNTDDNMFVEMRAPWALQRTDTTESMSVLDAVEQGVIPVLQQAGIALTPEMLGSLALSYVQNHGSTPLADKMLEMGGASSPDGLVSRVLVQAEATEQVDGDALDVAVARFPRAFSPRLERANLRYERSDYERSLADATVALEARPDDPRARLALVRALIDLERAFEAMAQAEALAASPYAQVEPSVWIEAAKARAYAGNLTHAADAVRRYVDLRPEDTTGWYLLSEYLKAAGQREKALEAVENQRRSARNAALSRHASALRAERAGRLEEAKALLEWALILVPDYEPAKADLRRLTQSRAASMPAR